MLSDIFYDIVSINNRGCKPISIVMTDKTRLLVMNEAQNGQMQLFADGEERLFGLPVKTDSTLKKDYEVLIK